MMTGWANYFQLGQFSPAYGAVDEHATRRLALSREDTLSVGERMIWSEELVPEIGTPGSMSGERKRGYGGD